MPSRDGLDEAVETALTQLIEAIYQRSEALAHDVSAAEYSKLDSQVSEAEELWKTARQRLVAARQRGANEPGTSSRFRGLPAKSRSV
jgi:hypothetical protein